jgi:hypothetical protein
MFTVRSWLLTVVGGLLAAYYTDNIEMKECLLWVALPLVTLLFLFVETRHLNLIEAVVKRGGEIEQRIVTSRKVPNQLVGSMVRRLTKRAKRVPTVCCLFMA